MSKYIKSQDRELNHIISKLIQAQHDSGKVKGSSDNEQVCNILVSAGGLGDIADCGDKEHSIGGVLNSLINICERNGTSMETCLNKYYEAQK